MSFILPAAHSLSYAGSDSGGKMTAAGAAATLSAGAVGAGLLALPSVMGRGGDARAGFVGGVIIVVLAVVMQRIANNCLSAAIDMAGSDCNSHELLMLRSFGKTAQVMTAILAQATVLGTCAAFQILIGTSVALFTGLPPKVSIGVTGILLMPLAFLPLNASLGLLAVAAETLVLPLVISKAFIAGPAKPEDWTPLGPTVQLGPAFCTMVFAIGFGVVLPAVKADMKEPSKMTTASDIAIGVCFVMYMFVMCLGYWAWGNFVEGNVLDTLSGSMLWVAKSLLDVNLVISYGIFAQVSVMAMSRSCGITTKKAGCVLRVAIVLFVCVVAVALPFFNEVIDLVSAVGMVATNYLIPVTCYWKLRRKKGLGVSMASSMPSEEMRTVISSPSASPSESPSDGSWGLFILHVLVGIAGVFALFFGLVGGVQNLVAAIHKN